MKKTHGLTRANGKKTRIWRIWQCINTRCTNKKHSSFKNHGARGIKNEWKNFIEFINDMYEPYLEHLIKHGEKNTTIDRINNDENYNKENCKWSTYKEQNRNIRKTKKLIYKGDTHLLVDLCEILNIKKPTLYAAYYRNNKKSFKCKQYEFKLPL